MRQGFGDYDAGGIDAFELDEIIHHYTQAARELWKFCAVAGERVTFAVRTLEYWRENGNEPDWWELPARSRRPRRYKTADGWRWHGGSDHLETRNYFDNNWRIKRAGHSKLLRAFAELKFGL